MIAINSEFVGLHFIGDTVLPNIILFVSSEPLAQATSIACLIALSTRDGVVLNFFANVGYNSLVIEFITSISCTANVIASLIY